MVGGSDGWHPGNKDEIKELMGSMYSQATQKSIDHIADVEIWDNIDSSQMIPQYWGEIARFVVEKLDAGSYRGVLILHGTDTMHYTSAALSFMLRGSPVPIVLTGAQQSYSVPNSDALNNLLDGIKVASEADLAETVITFNHRILRGTRVRKVRIKHPRDDSVKPVQSRTKGYFYLDDPNHYYNAFDCPNFPDLGRIVQRDQGGTEVVLDVPARRGRQESKLDRNDMELEPKVGLVKLYPGVDPDILEHYISNGIKGLVLETLGDAGFRVSERGKGEDLPELVAWVNKAKKADLPVVISSQCPSGVVTGDYAPFKKHLGDFAILGYDMLPEVAQVKLMWALRHTRDFPSHQADNPLDAVRRVMHQPLAHEIIVPSTH